MSNRGSRTPQQPPRVMKVFGWIAALSAVLSLLEDLVTVFHTWFAYVGDKYTDPIGAVAIINAHFSITSTIGGLGNQVFRMNGFPAWVLLVLPIIWAVTSGKIGIDLINGRREAIGNYLKALAVLIAVNLLVYHGIDFFGIAYMVAAYYLLRKYQPSSA